MAKPSKKELILQQAKKHFAEFGYELTTLDAVAAACEITKPAIYYHFKDKLTLYKAVICPEFSAIAQKIEENTQSGNAIERLQNYIHTFGAFLITSPEFSAIFAREMADGSQTMPDDCIKQLSRTLIQLISILEAGKKEGVFESEHPFLVQMMIVTTLTSYNTTRPIRERIAQLIDKRVATPEPHFHNIIEALSHKIIKGLQC